MQLQVFLSLVFVFAGAAFAAENEFNFMYGLFAIFSFFYFATKTDSRG